MDEAHRLLDAAEKGIRSEISTSNTRPMQAHLAYVRSRVTAMRGDLPRAIEFCLMARGSAPADNLALQLDSRITLGYEYFLNGDYTNAVPTLEETIRSGITAGAVINTVAASCLLARLYANQGLLHKSFDTYQMAAQSIPEARGQHLGVKALVEIGFADVFCEWLVEADENDKKFIEDLFFPTKILSINSVWAPGGVQKTKAVIS